MVEQLLLVPAGRLVLVDYCAWDPPPLRHGHAVAGGPLTKLRDVEVALTSALLLDGLPAPAAGTGYAVLMLAPGFPVPIEHLRERVDVLLAEVDLAPLAFPSDEDGVGGF